MSVFITGDTHIPYDTEKLNTKNFPAQKTMTKKDYLIVLGDFGLLWHENKTYYWWKEWFDERNFTTLWIDGNHENHAWIDSLPVSEWNGGKVHKITDSIIHLMRGQLFTIEGKTFWTFGGANSIDKEHRQEYISWWAREQGSYSEQQEGLANLRKVNNQVDYILTHTCPDELVEPMFYPKHMESSAPTGKYLDFVSDIVQYSHWYFGHWHEDKDFDKYTVLYQTVRHLI